MMGKKYSLDEIKKHIEEERFPFTGFTKSASIKFLFNKPSFYAGIAMHCGNVVRQEILDIMEVSKDDRFREEDPFTDYFIQDLPIQIYVCDSRFEYDVNRERYRAVYQTPDMAWGLNVLKRPLKRDELNRSLEKYDEFHNFMDIVTNYLLKKNKYALLLDIHAYNYQREKRLSWFEDSKPVINIGTGAVNRQIFGDVINDFINRLKKIKILSHEIYVGENVLFKGGYLSRRLLKKHYNNLLFIAIEFKKFFMDEWSGELDKETLNNFLPEFQKEIQILIDHPFLTNLF